MFGPPGVGGCTTTSGRRRGPGSVDGTTTKPPSSCQKGPCARRASANAFQRKEVTDLGSLVAVKLS